MAVGKGTAVIDFGATPVDYAQFTVPVAGLVPANYVECFVMVDTQGSNGVEDHRHAAASWKTATLAGTGSFTLDVWAMFDLMSGPFKIRYAFA
jgi:hypothetical protein